jgi:hypothetical protein
MGEGRQDGLAQRPAAEAQDNILAGHIQGNRFSPV